MKKYLFLLASLILASNTFALTNPEYSDAIFNRGNYFFEDQDFNQSLSGDSACADIVIKKVIDDRLYSDKKGKTTYTISLGDVFQDKYVTDWIADFSISGMKYNAEKGILDEAGDIVGYTLKIIKKDDLTLKSIHYKEWTRPFYSPFKKTTKEVECY
ncbi:hypothetical protein HBN50_03385 [Halobacteriovorax sp. GB3]|uniref:hypothetical protein n=1 Tax=Halobacteriovorax sp. GB3 TaxID=2719615 RepID=UPI00235EA8E9|nr:hypothetical protein [Halobacteriovorax sp. GB3]MDD0852120.1 hypothetical protein [Halobacteriovorax sp. GB3]